MIIGYDSETTGLPLWSEPSDSKGQPHIVELAAILTENDGTEVKRFESLVAPVDWTIPQAVIDIHGITNERAMDEGGNESDVLEEFLAMWRQADFRVAHSESFDARIIRIATKRYSDTATQEAWKAGDSQCTGRITRPILKLPGKGRYKTKMPKLSEAYESLIGKPIVGAHRAMIDTEACMEVYFAAQKVIDEESLL